MASANDVPTNGRVYRYEVEITERSSGSSYRVPLRFQQVVLILPRARRGRSTSPATTAKKSQEPPAANPSPQASTVRIWFEDGGFVLEASTWEEDGRGYGTSIPTTGSSGGCTSSGIGKRKCDGKKRYRA